MKMEFNENAIMATMNPIVLLICLLVTVVIAYVCSRKYSNTNDFKRSSVLYGCISVVMFTIYLWVGVPAMMAVGFLISGFVIMALFSNHFFNKN